jgi:hypothetical protein
VRRRHPYFGNVQQAVDIARRAFPTLRDVSETKIDFAIAPRKDMRGGPLISILDDAWAGMATWAPETMLVSVKESPEDKTRRKCHTGSKDDEKQELTLVILPSRSQARNGEAKGIRLDHLDDHRWHRIGYCRRHPLLCVVLGNQTRFSNVIYRRTKPRHRARATFDNARRYNSIRR